MATCAACLQPIVRSQRFLLDGTEAFHAQCVGQAYRSKLRITEQRGFALERQLEDTRRAAARVEVEANRLRNELTSAKSQVVVLEGRLAGERGLRDAAMARMDAKDDELRAARREIAELRAELAALKPETGAASDDIDATVQRFKMLELD